MRNRLWPWAVPTVALVLAVVTGCATISTTPPASTADSSQPATVVREGGQVTVAVTWAGPSAGPVFAVALDTHSVDLDGIDLGRLALLKTPAGDLSPSAWSAPRGGHHRSGELRFPATLPNGRPTLDGGPVELEIRDVAGVSERSFQWQP